MVRVELVAAAMVLLLVATACGGEDDAGSTLATNPTTDADDVSSSIDELVDVSSSTGQPGDVSSSVSAPVEVSSGISEPGSNPEFGVDDDVIRIGWIGDATGPAAFASGTQGRGAAAAVAYVNAQGGVAGRQLELAEFDNQFTAERAVSGYQSLVHDEHVLALVDTGPSISTTALIADIERDGVPVFGPGQTIDDQLAAPTIYNFVPHYRHQAELMVQSLEERVGGEELVVATVATDVPSAADIIAGVEDATIAAGGTAVGVTLVSPENPDYASAATAIAEQVESEGVNAVAIHGSAGSGIGLLNEFVTRGLDDLVVAGIIGLAAPDVFVEGPAEAATMLRAAHGALPASADCDMCTTIRAFTAGTDWESDVSNPYFSIGWTSVMLIRDSINRAAAGGGVLDWASINDAAKQAPFDDLGGLTCRLDFSNSNYSVCGTMFEWDGDGLVASKSFEDAASAMTWKPSVS